MTGFMHVVVLAAGLACAGADVATAGQTRPYRQNDQQLKDLVTRIDAHQEAFRASVGRAIDRSPIDGSRDEDEIDRSVESFEQATGRLRDRVNDRQSDSADAENVLKRASLIDALLSRHQLDTAAQRDWQALRLDMDGLARAYDIPWTWRGTSSPPSRVNDQQVDQLLKRISQRADQFDKSLDRAVDRDRRDARQSRDELHRLVTDLGKATDCLRDRAKGRQSTTLDVEDVLRRGASVDDFLQRSPLSGRPQQNWISLRSNLDALARAYNVSWNWSPARHTSANPGAAFRYQLTGTYQLETSQNEDPRRAAEQAARSVPADQRPRMVQRLLRRLEAPDLVAFERQDERVTMASTRGPRVTVDADGRDHPEPWSADRTMHTRATLEGERLMVVTTTGSRGSDFSVTFEPIDDGRRLRMTRTFDDEALRQPVTVRSTYRRLSDEPRWADMDLRDRREPSDDSGPAASVEGVVPDGTRLVAVLDNGLSTTEARDGESLAMTIHSPSRYEGGVITGVVSTTDDQARWAGRAGMTLTLTSIRLRDGRSYRFDGSIEEMRTPDGDTVRVDREVRSPRETVRAVRPWSVAPSVRCSAPSSARWLAAARARRLVR